MSTTGQGLSRRDFLRLTTMTAAGAVIAACAAPSAAPAGGSGGASAPASEPVKVIATTSMPVNTFDETIKRSKDQLGNINLEVNANSWGAVRVALQEECVGTAG